MEGFKCVYCTKQKANGSTDYYRVHVVVKVFHQRLDWVQRDVSLLLALVSTC